jgi:PKD repeat protein
MNMKKIIYLTILILIFIGLVVGNVSSFSDIKTIYNFENICSTNIGDALKLPCTTHPQINEIRYIPNKSQTYIDEQWTKTFGGTNIDVGYDVQQTDDGGYIISGYTRSYGASGHNIWLIKTDSSGNELWNKTFGGSSDDEGESVQQTADGGYIITGWTKSYGAGLKDLWLIKTDSSGNEQWNKLFGGSSDDGGTSVRQTSDGGYIISGYTSSYGAGSVDAWLIKTDSSGNQQWSTPLGGMSSDGAWCVQITTDGGFVLTGWTYSYGPGAVGNVWLVKTDSLGNQEWNKAFGGADVDRGYYVQQTTDEGYIITGYTASSGAGLDDMMLIKTDSSGTEQWTKTFGGTGRDYGNQVEQTFSGGYIIAGYTLSYGAGSEDVWLVKTDSSGNKVWDDTFGGTYSDVGYSVQQTTDGGYIVTGHTLSYGAGVHDVWLIKTVSDEIPLPLEVDAGGPYYGFVGDSINFIGNVAGGVPPYDYLWDFGDSNTSTQQNPLHIYIVAGNYTVTLAVTDDFGNVSSDDTWAIIERLNNPPNTPNITGPASGKPRVELEYNFSTVDPDLDNVFYFVDWDDGTNSGWVGPNASGDEIKIKHKWNTKEAYTIKCKAKDINGAESSWGSLEITIPRYKLIGNTLISRFIKSFSKIFFLIKTFL